jgi:hypothetical protein
MTDLPLLLPANLNAAIALIIPKTSCERAVTIFPCEGSGRWRVRREPEAVIICCSFVPANCPRIAWVMAVGGWTVKLYMNIDEVVAMLSRGRRKPAQLLQGYKPNGNRIKCIWMRIELTRQLVAAQITSRLMFCCLSQGQKLIEFKVRLPVLGLAEEFN